MSMFMIIGLIYLKLNMSRIQCLLKLITEGNYDIIILVVINNGFINMRFITLRKFAKTNHVLYDIKYILPSKNMDGSLS